MCHYVNVTVTLSQYGTGGDEWNQTAPISYSGLIGVSVTLARRFETVARQSRSTVGFSRLQYKATAFAVATVAGLSFERIDAHHIRVWVDWSSAFQGEFNFISVLRQTVFFSIIFFLSLLISFRPAEPRSTLLVIILRHWSVIISERSFMLDSRVYYHTAR